jgi:hypothetical protein
MAFSFSEETLICHAVIPAEAAIQFVTRSVASEFRPFGRGYNLGSSFRWNDGVVFDVL